MGHAAGILLAISCVASAASLQKNGEALFQQCEFKAAARAFEHALASEPESAQLHFWLGKSYERMADVASPFFARRNARKAQFHLEAAVRRDPGNREFLKEIFDFYVDSPEWFDGGLVRAHQILERLGQDDTETETLNMMVAQSRKEYSGREWVLGKGILRISGAAGYLVPLR
jgi:tetratricopeptide (TPR) repeat protein